MATTKHEEAFEVLIIAKCVQSLHTKKEIEAISVSRRLRD